MCTCSALFWLKAFSQSVQWNGRSRHPSLPVWMRLWRSSWLGLANAFSHVSHLNTLEGPAWCVCMCSWCVARLNAFLHTWQPWMRSWPTAADEKARSHSKHWCARPSFSGWPPWARFPEMSATWSESGIL
uniref:Uncharacterized protein n=1 Tax=Propithecus coquereli TaxID=379532 RepID=A0A2K6GPI0_PROCO